MRNILFQKEYSFKDILGRTTRKQTLAEYLIDDTWDWFYDDYITTPGNDFNGWDRINDLAGDTYLADVDLRNNANILVTIYEEIT